jgi:hypothetical protein
MADLFMGKVFSGLAHGIKVDRKTEFFQKKYFIGYKRFGYPRIPF